MWYWAAMCSLTPKDLPPTSKLKPVTEDTHKKLLLLYSQETSEASEAMRLLVQEFPSELRCRPLDLERLMQVWILNCFEHTDEPLGYATYFMSSFMSHSCRPNSLWHYDGDDFILRARERIQAGDEITVSYLSEDVLLDATVARRKHLKDSKHFICRCPRCSDPCDPCRGFRCPSCSSISLKFGAPQGDEDYVGATAMFGRRCEHCFHVLDFGQAALLQAEESLLEHRIEETEKCLQEKGFDAPDKELHKRLERLVQRVEKSLAQHYMLDKAYQLLSDLASRLQWEEDAERMMRKRMEYQAQSYAGLSGSAAWTWEAYGDMLLRHARCEVDPEVKVPDIAAAIKVQQTVPG
ncbi:SmydA-8, partial [Symbiodinium sp. CCMP2456]